MIRFKRAPNLMMAQHWANLLSTVGIQCEIHNRYMQGALGEIPVDQCGPELWLSDARDEVPAEAVLQRALAGPGPLARPWRCATCLEPHEAQFTVCWKCGSVRDPLRD